MFFSLIMGLSVVTFIGAGCTDTTTTSTSVVKNNNTLVVKNTPGNTNVSSTNISKNTNDTPVSEVRVEDLAYNDSLYQFNLTFPQSWEGYTFKNRTVDWGTLGTSDSVDFGFSENTSLFNVSIHTKDQWQKIKSENGPTPTYLGENDTYVFAYSVAQDVSSDAMASRMAEVSKIIETFSVN